MKKVLFYFSCVVFTAMVFSSCKKDYVCECTYTSTFDEQQYTTEFDYEGYRNKGLAEELCEDQYISFANNVNCKLK